LSNRSWTGPQPFTENDEKTIFIEMNVTTTYTSL
jgi:hypothetical protein